MSEPCASCAAVLHAQHAELLQLRAGYARTRALHWPSEATVDLPAVCVECVKDYPCPTVRALGDPGREPPHEPPSYLQSGIPACCRQPGIPHDKPNPKITEGPPLP